MSCKIFYSTVLTPFILLAIFSTGLAADKELKFLLPHLSPLVTPDQCKCEAIVSTSVYGNTIQNKGILGKLSKGTDKVSIQIEGDILYFLSGASFESGTAKPFQFQIIHNWGDQLLAFLPYKTQFGFTIDIFTLNKKTGLAVWTTTRALDFFSGAPSGHTTYLKCK